MTTNAFTKTSEQVSLLALLHTNDELPIEAALSNFMASIHEQLDKEKQVEAVKTLFAAIIDNVGGGNVITCHTPESESYVYEGRIKVHLRSGMLLLINTHENNWLIRSGNGSYYSTVILHGRSKNNPVSCNIHW